MYGKDEYHAREGMKAMKQIRAILDALEPETRKAILDLAETETERAVLDFQLARGRQMAAAAQGQAALQGSGIGASPPGGSLSRLGMGLW